MTTTRNASGPPLTARSLIASMLLGLDPPRTTAQFLVRSNELFGVTEGTTRTALSRMVAAAELSSHEGTYELAGDLLARQSRQSESRRAERTAWDGTWCLAVIDREARSAGERAAFRQAAKQLRLVEWREGVWSRPDNLDPHRLPDSRGVVSAQSTWVTGARTQSPPLDRFGATEWAERAESLIGAMRDLEPTLRPGDRTSLQRGFVLSADVIRHFGSDPLLPDELIDELAGERWPGTALRDAFDRHQAAFRDAHRSWFAAS